MDRIEFTVAQVELGIGAQECAEPVINSERLVDLLAGVEREPGGYAGLPPERLFRGLSLPEGVADVQVLRCICGDDLCSWARVEIETGTDEVLWHNFRGSRADADVYKRLGPFRFEREQYERALRQSPPSSPPR